MVELEGRLVEIIFQNEANGYLVGILDCEDEEVTIVGCLPALKEGEVIAVKGKWIVHPTYGRQMDVKEYRHVQPSTKEGILNYLSSGVIKGIGKKMAERIIDHFGTDALEVIQYAPQRLTEVSGIGEAKAQTIAEAFEEQRELREIILFLSQYGISPGFAVRIYKKYKEMTIAYIQENPYRLADEIIGIGFKKADLIARTMGISPNSKYRIHSGIRYTINTFHTEGHTYAPSDLLIDRARELLGVEEEAVVEGIQEMALKQKIQLERQDEEIIVYSMPYFYAETNCCNKLIELSQIALDTLEIDVDEEISNIEREDGIYLAENQKEAIRQAITNGILVITGGPGTGKTTTINTLIKVFEKLKKKIVLAAPTGRASKRMTEATGKEAKTIHRLLEMGYSDEDEGMLFQRNEDNPLVGDVIIIDEVSMVDIMLMNSLLKAISRGTRLIFVGDVDQLPSVGAGNVLRDIIDSQVIKVVRLNEIFRQAGESMIVVNAHKINQGDYPILNHKDKDFYFINRSKNDDILNTIIGLVKERLPKHYKFDPIRDIQVLTPMKKGDVGTLNLNKELQNYLNPPDKYKRERELREKIFRVGDKVMQIKNNYTLKWTSLDVDAEEKQGEGVFNGDIGYVQYINTEEQELTVFFDDNRSVVYSFTQLDELELAYSITIHKSQGSEFPVVVMPVTWGPPMLLTRNLLYTAITRAKSLVVLVGTENYLRRMVDNNKIVERYSGLGIRLKKFFDFQNS
ncbi:SF1B family DNA helicase RecD2 [Alkaliphilus sp. B6464]|uniref:SF1B family DNA helicase RecD2 n=1 Tax=Alkaliphilus sp. B6464 TaxID=2731219 RepID=UPI001BA5527B|nr:ATP-dependent RecD-like DNA helicase [Alkaliphilus sp. B6464]QUH19027.1 ATP-dependent RecD-like DNA helicase [Alkaliphilus sp. B6464]